MPKLKNTVSGGIIHVIHVIRKCQRLKEYSNVLNVIGAFQWRIRGNQPFLVLNFNFWPVLLNIDTLMTIYISFILGIVFW